MNDFSMESGYDYLTFRNDSNVDYTFTGPYSSVRKILKIIHMNPYEYKLKYSVKHF